MNKYKLIIFDLDDTLFDYTKTEKYAVLKACEKLGVVYNGDIYTQYKKANNIVREQYIILTSKNIQQFRDSRALIFFALINNYEIHPNAFIKEYLQYSTGGILIDGVQETLCKLEGILKVIATNGTNYPRQNKLERSQIAKYFDAYFSAENMGVDKPNPEFFLRIIHQYAVLKNEVLIVGDDYLTDIKGAINIGIDCCWFNFHKRKLNIELPENVFVIDKFDELLSII